MKITDAPALITTPFAQSGTRNDIPDTDPGFTGDTAGRAAFATGFPEITMRPVAAGGVPPFGADFNGILYALSNAVRFYGAGGHYKFNADFASKIGGYPMGATVQATDNMGHWLNVVEANSTDPESGLSTGWLPLADHNGTATVTLTGNTTLTSLQAAKANLRFTGTPTGNVTVTFPAWTKRYSIINECTGDGSVICTTGNGESISIKNGAKYEVGCDGKNLTTATFNASQVLAETNKNISALDLPTVQQLLNALGSAATHAAGDFDTAGSAKTVQEELDVLSNSLAIVSRSGSYNDLSEKPSLGNSSSKDCIYADRFKDYTELTYDEEHLPTVAVCTLLRDGLLKVIDSLNKSLSVVARSGKFSDLSDKPYLGDASTKGVIYGTQDPNDAGWDDGKVASGAYVKRVMQYYLETYAIGSYMYCQPVSNTNELVPGDIVDGQYLRPSSGNKVGGLGGLPGQWKCKGYSVNSGVAALERVTLFQRFS